MKKSLLVFAIALVACSSTPRVPDAERARAGLSQMHDGIIEAAHECSLAANATHSDVLFNYCVNTLIPARDAVHFADEAAKPWWSPRAGSKIACAGKATATALTDLCAPVHCSERVKDTLIVATELGESADSTCDPKHPTTEVFVTEDMNIPRVEPEYPPLRW